MTDARRAAGQVLVGGFDGDTPPQAFLDLVSEGRVGGAILFTRNLPSVERARDLVRALSSLPSSAPLLVSIDQEGGRVQRLRAPFPEMPPLRRFGEAGRKTLALRLGEVQAAALRVLGFHQNYAPVLDVDSNPANPVIGDRAFSSDPHRVSRLGAAYVEGLQSGGVAACGKHFPGHGDTSVDSHLALPRLDHDRERLDALELLPFRAAIRARVASIMTAHILFPALDAEHPVTLSEHFIEPVLRRELQFDGVVVSDDLEMKAIADHYGIEEAVVRALRAGCDQILICHQTEWVERAYEAIVKAVESGELAQERLLHAAERVARLKAEYVAQRHAPRGELSSLLPLGEHRQLLADLESSADTAPLADASDAEPEFDFEGDPEDIPELDV